MNFTLVAGRVAQVVLHVFGQQVTAVACRVDQHVGRGRGHRAIEDGLECLVAALAVFKAQVIAVDDEALRAVGHQLDDVRQVHHIGLVDLDQAQALAAVGVQAGLDQRGLAGAARARHQHVVGRQAFDELLGVGLQAGLLPVDFLQVVQAQLGHVTHGLQAPCRVAALAIAPGHGLSPIGCGCGLRQNRFDARQHGFGALQQRFKSLVHGRCAGKFAVKRLRAA